MDSCSLSSSSTQDDESSPALKTNEFEEQSSGSGSTAEEKALSGFDDEFLDFRSIWLQLGGIVVDSLNEERSFEESLGAKSVLDINETSLDSPKGECGAEKFHGSMSTADVGKKECNSEESPGSETLGKTGKKKECSDERSSGSVSTLKAGKNSVNKISSQIKKPPHRRSASPLNWFPRKKTDSFMKRKIRFLQEVGGMNSSLDETLGDSNPHYCRVEREKIAAREAAQKAMEARKAAMVEASWCQILRAARIPSKEAESRLAKAEESVTKAFAEAAAMGVTMYDKPDCPQQACEIETSAAGGGGSTHKVTASFETAFEVDKEVAAAVKTAFIRLANCPNSSNEDEFQDLLRKISQNPDQTEPESSECESDHRPDFQEEPSSDGHFGTSNVNTEIPAMESRPFRNKKLPSNSAPKGWNSSIELVDMMFDRLKQLQEDELASLATIVATCGLNATLREAESNKQIDPDSISDYSVGRPPVPVTRAGSRRESSFSRLADGNMKRKQTAIEVPSLDKFLVKHVSRLEREVREARNSRKTSAVVESGKTMEGSGAHVSERNAAYLNNVPDLGSILVKHTSRFEKEIEEAKKSQRALEKEHKYFNSAKDRMSSVVADQVGKENIDSTSISAVLGRNLPHRKDSSRVKYKYMSRIERAKLDSLQAFSAQDGEGNGLDKILVKSMHRLEREKMKALAEAKDNTVQGDKKNPGIRTTNSESLDKVLVKHVSRLEKEKMAYQANETGILRKRKDNHQLEKTEESLDKVLVKHQSGLEKVKSATAQQFTDHAKHSETRRKARERELEEAWGGLSLGNSIKPHVSRLEREKASINFFIFTSFLRQRKRSEGKIGTTGNTQLDVLVGVYDYGILQQCRILKPCNRRITPTESSFLECQVRFL
ncbi:hypothetical protein ACLOJK_035926 [Asimina triloba]